MYLLGGVYTDITTMYNVFGNGHQMIILAFEACDNLIVYI